MLMAVTDIMDKKAKTGAGSVDPGNIIVGLGKTGLSCARFLARRNIAFQVVDSRLQPPGLAALRTEFPDVQVTLGSFPSELFHRAEQLIVSPGVSLREPAIRRALQAGVPVGGDIDLFVRHVGVPVVAVTGSNGKSTVTTLLGEMARNQGRRTGVGGNLGTPVLELLERGEQELYILELSSFQLETTHALNAMVAVVLNISSDHMDRYADLQEYAEAKQRIFRGDGVIGLNRDDPRVVAMGISGRRTVGFTLMEPTGSDYGLRKRSGVTWLARGKELLMEERGLGIRGRFNTANALAALAVGEAMGLTISP
ncbi:MAG: UDP-N-acetylmuramoyl-L-alanine--D-glutamate ligase, partial [Gammaproteobacteria bacterium]|nr:UDP-N-acetylmuramoyl-L-alanine--D-glutamate ligase [Gammaproteobacteria bacterium]